MEDNEVKLQNESGGNTNVTTLLNRGYMSLEDGEFEEAKSFFNRALDIDYQLAEAYLGLLMAELRARNKDDARKNYVLGGQEENRYWKRARQFAGQELASELDEWENSRKEENEQKEEKVPESNNSEKRKIITFAVAGIVVIAIVFLLVISKKSPVASMKDANVGDIVSFGSYEQDNDTSNGKEAIEWLILDKQEGKLLLISEKALDCQPFNTEYEDVTWETCTLRNWLNSEFLNTAFSSKEQKWISKTTVSADRNPDYSTNPGNATTDQVFLLSINEANQYFTTGEARQCALTSYAKAQGAYTDDGYKTAGGEAACWWWLRSPGGLQNNAASVFYDGSVYSNVSYVHDGTLCVRPALWIDLDS